MLTNVIRAPTVRQALSHRSPSGSADLQDMSVMVLRTQGPAALFDDHKLVLHTSSHDAKRAQVFHACGEFMPLLHPQGQGPSYAAWGWWAGPAQAPGLLWGPE